MLLLRAPTTSNTTFGTTVVTHSSKADTIYDLKPSRDRDGGDQLSLSFRLKILDTERDTDRCLLLWGDKNYVKFEPVGDADASPIEHLLVFMPMIWMRTFKDEKTGKKDRALHVYFNCNNKVLNECVGNIGEPLTDLVRHGVIITVAFTDYSVNLASKGCMCSLYVNARLVASTKVEYDTIRRNIGLLYVLPSTSLVPGIRKGVKVDDESDAANVQISDLSYHNYEIGVTEITDKIRGDMQYDRDRDVPREKNRAYDATRDLAYHNLITPVYA